MLPSPLEVDVVYHEDFELARSVKWELMQLRSRSTTPTADDVMLIARKAGLAEFLQYTSSSRTTVDVVRADAWLAICTLADSIAKNARAIREDQHDTVAWGKSPASRAGRRARDYSAARIHALQRSIALAQRSDASTKQ